MRKIAISLLMTACLCAPVLAGDVNSPGKTDPPCTQNCATTSTTSTAYESVRQIALDLILIIVKP